MASIVAVVASTHHPFYYRASTATGEDRPPFADEWTRKILAFRETLTRAAPDVLVMVGSDHFHQLRAGLDAGFDLAFSNELRIDHSITCPIITLRPEADLPIVPVYTNIFAPPLPQPKRFVQLGAAIRSIVESWPSHLRVAIVGTGHLSLELGGPRQFGPHGPDPEFDRRAVEWIAAGDLDGCLREVTLDSLHAPGNATHGFMDFMLMMGVAGAGAKADHVDTLDLFHTMEAYFTWYPNGAPAA
jgi:protocatechuate 4,5-dioxygenase beta chain